MKKKTKKHKIPKCEVGDILVIKVGNEERPASADDIQDVMATTQLAIANSKKKKAPILVTHHVIEFQVVKGAISAVLVNG